MQNFFNDWHVRGLVTANDITQETGTPIDDDAVADTAKINASKFDGQQWYTREKPDGTLIDTTEEYVVYTCISIGGATLKEVSVAPINVPTSSKQYDVDIEKSTGGGAWASMLSSTVTINSGSTARTRVSATLSTTDIAQGDSVRITITPSGGAGTEGDGVVIGARIEEVGKW